MLLESCQILSAVVREKYKKDIGYKSGWKNHPCTKWASHSNINWEYLFVLANELSREYTYRYNRKHKCQDLLDIFEKEIIPTLIEPGEITTPYLAMPDDCKTEDIIQSYRNYYLKYKSHLLTYTRRKIPEWVKEAGLGTWKERKF